MFNMFDLFLQEISVQSSRFFLHPRITRHDSSSVINVILLSGFTDVLIPADLCTVWTDLPLPAAVQMTTLWLNEEPFQTSEFKHKPELQTVQININLQTCDEHVNGWRILSRLILIEHKNIYLYKPDTCGERTCRQEGHAQDRGRSSRLSCVPQRPPAPRTGWGPCGSRKWAAGSASCPSSAGNLRLLSPRPAGLPSGSGWTETCCPSAWGYRDRSIRLGQVARGTGHHTLKLTQGSPASGHCGSGMSSDNHQGAYSRSDPRYRSTPTLWRRLEEKNTKKKN